MVRSPPALQETWIWSLGQEDSPGAGNGNPLPYFCLESSMEQSGGLQSIESQRVGHNWDTNIFTLINDSCVINSNNITFHQVSEFSSLPSLPSVPLLFSIYYSWFFSVSVQLLSRVQLFVTPWTAAPQASLSITNSQSLLKLMSIELVMPSNHLILYCSLLPPSIFPSIRVFSNESVLRIRWPEYWSFSFSISPSNEYSQLISLEWTGWISLQSKGLSRVFSNTTVQRHQFFGASCFCVFIRIYTNVLISFSMYILSNINEILSFMCIALPLPSQ